MHTHVKVDSVLAFIPPERDPETKKKKTVSLGGVSRQHKYRSGEGKVSTKGTFSSQFSRVFGLTLA